MENILLRNKIPPLSSHLNKSQSNTIKLNDFNYENIFKINELRKNNSIDFEELNSSNRPQIVRKFIKSGGEPKKLGNFERFMSNIRSSENIYKNMHLRNAPSFNKNLSEIHSIIKRKKYKNIKIIDSFFFNSNFQNNNIDDYTKMKNDSFSYKRKKAKLKPIHRNHSCVEFSGASKNANIHKIIKREHSPQLSTNFSKAIFIKKSNPKITDNKILYIKNLKHNTSNISTTTNKSLLTNRLPEFQSNSNSKICVNEKSTIELKSDISLPKINTHITKQTISPPIDNSYNTSLLESEKFVNESPKYKSCFITNLNTDKMRFSINKLLINKKKDRMPIDVMEEKILKMKIFQNYQRESLEKYLKDERFKIDEKIDYVVKMYKKYDEIYRNYITNLNRYIEYIFHIVNTVDIDLRVLKKNKKDILYEIEILIDKLVTKQIEFEYLISTRNFIFWVKNLEKINIKMNNQYIYRYSRRKKFVDTLFDMFGRTPDSFAFKYLKKIIPLEQLENIITRAARRKTIGKRQSTIKQSISLTMRTERINDEFTPPPPGEKIFDTPDDFIKTLEIFRDRDIDLLKKYGISEIEKGSLINELNIENEIYEKISKTNLYNYINKDLTILESEKKKNILLTKKYEYITNQIKKKNDLSSLKQDFKVMSINEFNDISAYNLIKYNKLRISNKFEGLVLFENLINNISYILTMDKTINIFDLDEVYNYIPRENLVQLLRTKKENFNNNNQYLIKVYTLQLLKLYTYFCEIITKIGIENKKLYGDKFYNLRERVIMERKLNNAKIIKKMAEDRRDIEINRLNEKWNRQVNPQNRKSDIEIQPNVKVKIINKTIQKKKQKIKKTENDEFNKYNDIFDDE